jgi:hypothetical protein
MINAIGLERMSKKTAVVEFKPVPMYLPERTEKNNKKP